MMMQRRTFWEWCKFITFHGLGIGSVAVSVWSVRFLFEAGCAMFVCFVSLPLTLISIPIAIVYIISLTKKMTLREMGKWIIISYSTIFSVFMGLVVLLMIGGTMYLFYTKSPENNDDRQPSIEDTAPLNVPR